jgi:hypothetical protein
MTTHTRTRISWWLVGLMLALSVMWAAPGLAVADDSVPQDQQAQQVAVTRSPQPAADEPPVLPYKLFLPLGSSIPLADRLGFDAVGDDIARYGDIGSFYAGWYTDWNARKNPPRPGGIEFVQTVRLHQKLTCGRYSDIAHDRTKCPYATPLDYEIWPYKDALAEIVRLNPGSLWLIGNEMDRRDWYHGWQDETLPETYAVAYHDLHHYITGIDPTARVAIGGMIQATPLRLAYLTTVWNTYIKLYGPTEGATRMPVDVWNVHNFILKENKYDFGAGIPPGSNATTGVIYPTDRSHVDLNIFAQQIRDFRSWMKAHGEQEMPLIVSEYGVLYYHDGMESPTVVQNFMIGSFDYFRNTRDCSLGWSADDCRLVQRWAWYSLDDYTGNFNRYGNLFNYNALQITSTGIRFRDYSSQYRKELMLKK